MSLFAAPELAKRLKKGFPESLNGQPLLANAATPYFERLMNCSPEWGSHEARCPGRR